MNPGAFTATVFLLGCFVPGLSNASKDGHLTHTPHTSTVGIETALSVVLPLSGLCPRPVHPRDPLILRIRKQIPLSSGGARYQLLYTGFVPGKHDLSEYLVTGSGLPPAHPLPSIHVSIQSVLPREHDGRLDPLFPFRLPWRISYRWCMTALWVFWLMILAVLVWMRRPRQTEAPPPPPPPTPTLVERLRPLVERAAQGTLDLEGKRRIDMLLLHYWRDALELDDRDIATSIGRPRLHPQAGPLLTQIERWLHSPQPVPLAEIQRVLEPFHPGHSPSPDCGTPPTPQPETLENPSEGKVSS